jgi:glycosyltransferase involved in cell wall biosynthesis
MPRVLVTDSQAVDHRRSRWKEAAKRAIIGRPECAFVAGATSRRYAAMLGVPAERIVDGCDVVDNTHFSAAAALRGLKERRLLTVIRLAPTKNLLAAAEAFLRFAEQRPEDWTWSIAGYGPLENELRALADQSNGRIRLLGGRQYAELPQVFADADVYWQPSVSEPWGLAVNEAMAAGLPVFASTRCGCVEDLVTGNTGWTFDPVSVPAMVEGLERVAADRDRWETMGRAAAELIVHWDLDRFSEGVYRAACIATGKAE